MPAQQPIDRFTYSRNGVGNRDERCMIRVNIPGVTTDTPHTLYKIDVTNLQSNQTWQTSHRYSEFLALRNELTAQFAKAERKCPGCLSFEKVIKLFEFPSKHLFTSKNPMVVNYRKKALKAFLALLASHTFTSAPKCPTCSGSVFTAVRDFLTEDPDAGARAESISSSGSGGERDTIDSVQIKNRDTIRESIQVKNFTTYVPVPKMKPVNSEGAFIRDEDRRKGSSRSSRNGGGSTATKGAGAATQKNTSTTSGGGGSARKLQQKPAAKVMELPSPLSSTMSSTSSTASPPASPHKLADNGNAESFVSFSGEAPTAHPTNAGSTPRRGSSKRNKNKAAKKSSQSTQLQAQASVKESMDDDEFGSLNMDFMTSMSVAKN